jgi:hypothetical protein
MHPYLAETFTAGRIADLHREAVVARLAAEFPQARLRDRWTVLGTPFAAWAERPRPGRSQGVCCPA